MLSRRSLLAALLLAPLAKLWPKAKPEIDVRNVARVANIDVRDCFKGSDQTSIWLASWGWEKPREFTGPYAKWQRRMWLRGRIS